MFDSYTKGLRIYPVGSSNGLRRWWA